MYFVQYCRAVEPGTLRLPNYTDAEHFFGLCLQVFRQTMPPQRVDYLAPMELSVKCLSQECNDSLPV